MKKIRKQAKKPMLACHVCGEHVGKPIGFVPRGSAKPLAFHKSCFVPWKNEYDAKIAEEDRLAAEAKKLEEPKKLEPVGSSHTASIAQESATAPAKENFKTDGTSHSTGLMTENPKGKNSGKK